MAGLSGVARVALPDRHAVQQARGADLVAPHPGHVGHAGGGERLLDHRRAQHRAVAAHLVRSAAHRRHAQQDRVVAVVERLDLQDRFRVLAAGVIAGPLAERTLHLVVAGAEMALDHHLGVGRERQAGDPARNAVQRRAPDAADDVEFTGAGWRLGAGSVEGHRLAAQHHDDWTALAPREMLFAVRMAVLARHHQDADRLAVVHHRAVGADIEPAVVGIAGDRIASGADITSPVRDMPDRCRELHQVDVLAGEHVLQHRAVGDDAVGDQRPVLHEAGIAGLAEFDLGQPVRKAQRHVAPPAGEDVHDQPVARRAARHVLEQYRRPVVALDHGLGGKADILLPGRAAHHAEFAQPVGLGDPFPEIAIGQHAAEIVTCHPRSPSERVTAGPGGMDRPAPLVHTSPPAGRMR